MTVEPTKLLLVEDNPGDAKRIEDYLHGGEQGAYHILRVDRLEAALELLANGGIDVTLLELALPDSQGIDTLRRARSGAPEVPVVVVTDLDDENTALEALRAGAQDYVVKGRLDALGLRRSVRYALERHRLLAVLRQVSRDLQASEERFRFLVQNSSDIIATLEIDGTFRYLSPSVQQLLGYLPEELVGTPILDLVHFDDSANLSVCLAKASQDRKRPSHVEFRLRNHEGGWRTIEGAFTNVADPLTGQRIVANFRDTTEMRIATARRTVRDAVTRVFAESPDMASAGPKLLAAMAEPFGWDVGGLWILEGDSPLLGSLQAWQASDMDAADFLAASANLSLAAGVDFPGRVWQKRAMVWVGELGAEFDSSRAAAAASAGLRSAFGFPILFGDEVRGVIEFLGKDLAEPDEQLVAMMTSIGGQSGQFIQRCNAERALVSSEERYRLLADNAPDLIYRYRLLPTPGFDYVSQAAIALTGYTPEEHYADSNIWKSIVHPDDLPEVDRLLAAGEVPELPQALRWVRKDGTFMWIEQRSRAVRDPDGRLIAIEGIARDVGERHLLEDQLRQSQKMEAIGRLAGGVAHDFNNMLTAISGYSELLLSTEGFPAAHVHAVSEIRRAASRATSLTRQLLAFSRHQILQPKIIALTDVVSDAQHMLRRLIGEDIDLVVTGESQLGRVKADPGQIEQVIMNLVINARDAMPQGGRVTIESHNVDVDMAYARQHIGLTPGKYVMLAVADTGTGMGPEVKARLFEPFFTTKAAGKGTGLGLATVYGIVKQSGGHLSVYSELGRGSTFKFYLPRVFDPIEVEHAIATDAPSLAGSETVLVVEDDETVRSLIVEVLGLHGYRMLEVGSPTDALTLIDRQTEPIHLLLTDLVMPGMSGQALVEHLLPRFPNLKVLLMSGYIGDSLVHKGIRDSDTPFLQKPFSVVALARQVREVLDHPRASARAVQSPAA